MVAVVINAACKICSEQAIAERVNELREGGAAMRDIAAQVQRSKSSIQRHLKHIQKKTAELAAVEKAAHRRLTRREKAAAKTGDSGPLDTPAALIDRARAMIGEVEVVVDNAVAAGNDVMVLRAQKELRESLSLLMKAMGMLQSGPTVNISLDARQQAIEAKIDAWDEEFILSRLSDRDDGVA